MDDLHNVVHKTTHAYSVHKQSSMAVAPLFHRMLCRRWRNIRQLLVLFFLLLHLRTGSCQV